MGRPIVEAGAWLKRLRAFGVFMAACTLTYPFTGEDGRAHSPEAADALQRPYHIPFNRDMKQRLP